MRLSASEKRMVATALKPDSTLGTFAVSVVTVWVALSLFLANYVSDYLLLAWFYGPFRVYKEGLHFTYVPSPKRGDDFIVSNGDHISNADAFIGEPMAVAVWLALSLPGYLAVRHFSRRRKEALLRKIINDDYDD
jgi:hypothetical protein